MLGLVAITAGVGFATSRIGYMDTEIYFPLVDVNIDLGWLVLPVPLPGDRRYRERRST